MFNVRKLLSVAFLASFTCFTYFAFIAAAAAHGEDKPGPNGGEIRMPGAFHTEVVSEVVNGTPSVFRVFLLDFEFKNPVVAESSVEALIRDGQKSTRLKCQVDGKAFKCQAPAGFKAAKGDLVIKAKREKSQGNEAVYKLPLRQGASASPAKPAKPAKGHGHHGHHHH